ncbi:hypothetical protein JTB14_027482 [Gonioctena quinquepunctata]|nr:hypothetical protein JTB14_027482 [Gonioctena quinquepunctata]
MFQSSQAKNAVCRHDDDCEEIQEYQEEKTNSNTTRYIAENKLLLKLVKELESKSDILRENCSLLRKKVVFLSEKQEISTKHEDKNSNYDQGKTTWIRSTSKSPQPKKTTTESKQPYSAATVATNKIPNHAETFDSNPNMNIQYEKSFISRKEVSAAISNAQSMNKMKEVLDLDGKENGNWEKVVNRRFLVGDNDNNTSISTILKYTSLHVTRRIIPVLLNIEL